jgi:hypothetical protein
VYITLHAWKFLWTFQVPGLLSKRKARKVAFARGSMPHFRFCRNMRLPTSNSLYMTFCHVDKLFSVSEWLPEELSPYEFLRCEGLVSFRCFDFLTSATICLSSHCIYFCAFSSKASMVLISSILNALVKSSQVVTRGQGGTTSSDHRFSTRQLLGWTFLCSPSKARFPFVLWPLWWPLSLAVFRMQWNAQW